MRRTFLAAVALGLLTGLQPLSVPRAEAAIPAAAQRITSALRRDMRKAQRVAENRVSTAALRPSAQKSIVTSRSGRFDVRPSIRKLREDAERNAAIERNSYSRPNRGLPSAEEPDESPPTSTPPARTPLRRTEGEIELAKQRLLELVNAVREEHGALPLKRNMLLEAAAQDYADDMHDRNFFSHESPDGTTFDQRIEAAGYPGPCDRPGCRMRIYMGENLAKGFDTPESVLKGWMDSPGHRANILSENFSEVGLGISGNYWSQSFGKVEITN